MTIVLNVNLSDQKSANILEQVKKYDWKAEENPTMIGKI